MAHSNDSTENKMLSQQQLSQLMDGEWHDMDPAACLVQAGADEQLRHTWSRWHLIRDVARSEPVQAPAESAALTARIQAAIADEPSYSNVMALHGAEPSVRSTSAPASRAQTAEPRRRGFVPQVLTGAALAASVAVATVFGLEMIGSTTTGGEPVDVQSVAEAELPPLGISEGGSVIVAPNPADVELVGNTSGGYWVTPDENGDLQRSTAEERLNRFLTQHLENAPTATRSGMLPYSGLIGYDDLPGDDEQP